MAKPTEYLFGNEYTYIGIASMAFMPFSIIGIWLRGLFSIAIIAIGILLLNRWYNESHVIVPVQTRLITLNEPPAEANDRIRKIPLEDVPTRRVFRFNPGLNHETAYFTGGIGLLAIALAGRWILKALSSGFGTLKHSQKDQDSEPRSDRGGEVHKIRRPDGSEIRIECYGPIDGIPIVMTHGWGCNSTEWFYPKKNLTDRFRLILWDEPGLGMSKKPDNNDYRMEKLAADLAAVLNFAGDRPAILVGHSIGGMIILTFCRTFPELLGTKVVGLMLVHTTYVNPLRTTKMSALYTTLEKPIIIPLLHITIALWPLVWLMNWLGYLNGSMHRSTHKESFAGTETQGQLDFIASFLPRARPDVLARGMLGMIAYDATATLPKIGIPTMIVIGDQDSTTLPEAGEYISQNIPGSQLVTLAPAKHLGLIERHHEFSDCVVKFAESCLPNSMNTL